MTKLDQIAEAFEKAAGAFRFLSQLGIEQADVKEIVVQAADPDVKPAPRLAEPKPKRKYTKRAKPEAATGPVKPAVNGAFVPGLRDLIVADLEEHGATRVLDLAARLGVNNSYVSQCCSKLMADGRLRLVKRGIYEAIPD